MGMFFDMILSWIFTVFFREAVCFGFSFDFSFKTATGIFGIIMLFRLAFIRQGKTDE